MPEIETERLRLRMFSPDDAGDFYRIVRDAEFRKYLPPQFSPTPESVAAAIPRILAHWRERGYGQWALSLKESGEFIGYCGLRFLPDTEEVEVLYGIDGPHWNKGLVTEAAQAALRFGFEQSGLERIIALAHPENVGTRRVMEKAGLRYEKDAVYFEMVCAYYALDREGYRPDDAPYLPR